MAKRMLMIMMFVGALGAASLVAPDSAEARHRCRGGGWGYGYGYAPVYSTYYGGGFYAPRPVYYGGPGFYGGHHHVYRGGGVGIYGPRGGVNIRW